MSIAGTIGCTAPTLNEWLMKAEFDSGRKPGLRTDMAAKLSRKREPGASASDRDPAQGIGIF